MVIEKQGGKLMERNSIKLLIIFIIFSLFVLNFNLSILAADTNTDERGSEINNINFNLEIIDDRPMVQLRELATKFRWLLSYHPQKKIITIYDREAVVHLQIDNHEFEGKEMDFAPVIKDGRTFIGLEWINPLFLSLENETVDLVTAFAPEQKEVKPGEKIQINIQVYNISGDSLTLKYSSGQLFDVWLVKKEEEIWRWSDDKFFTMALMAKDLEPLEKMEHDLEMTISKDLEPGRYLLKGKLATRKPLSLETVAIRVISADF